VNKCHHEEQQKEKGASYCLLACHDK